MKEGGVKSSVGGVKEKEGFVCIFIWLCPISHHTSAYYLVQSCRCIFGFLLLAVGTNNLQRGNKMMDPFRAEAKSVNMLCKHLPTKFFDHQRKKQNSLI